MIHISTPIWEIMKGAQERRGLRLKEVGQLKEKEAQMITRKLGGTLNAISKP